MNLGPTSLLPRLSWLWIGSLLGGLAGLALAILCIVLFRALPIPGLQAWIFGSTTWIGIGLLLLGWLTSLGILLTQCTLGLMFWTRGKKEEDPASGLAGTLGFSAATALASSALFLIAWKSIPHAPFLAMIWPPVAVGLQLSLLGAGTPWLLLLASLLRRLPSRQQQFGQLLHTLIEQVRATVRTQLPRFLIALHATGISFALWLSPLLQTSDFRKTHHILISLLQAVVLLILTLGHLWLARSALLAFSSARFWSVMSRMWATILLCPAKRRCLPVMATLRSRPSLCRSTESSFSEPDWLRLSITLSKPSAGMVISTSGMDMPTSSSWLYPSMRQASSLT